MNTVLCVGHNKGWEEAASTLSGQPVRLKNACAALLEVSRSWMGSASKCTGRAANADSNPTMAPSPPPQTRATSWADALGGDEQRTWALVNVVGGASSA